MVISETIFTSGSMHTPATPNAIIRISRRCRCLISIRAIRFIGFMLQANLTSFRNDCKCSNLVEIISYIKRCVLPFKLIVHKHKAHHMTRLKSYGVLVNISSLLPDNNSLFFRKEHCSVCDVEGLVEGCDIAEGSVNAVLAEGVNVNLCKACRLLVTDVLSPDCCI